MSRDIVAGYGNKYEFHPVKTIKHQELMCYAYRWEGEKKVRYKSRHDFSSYGEMVEHLWSLLDEADIVVAHNGNKFDVRMANRFFVKEGLWPTSPYKQVDTLKIARRYFKFQSNSLNDLGEYLSLGSKRKITYADLEDDFMSDNPSKKTERLMREYNVQDVVLLEKIYNVLSPYDKSHPNEGDILQVNGVCPKCGSTNVHPYGSAPRRHGRVIAYRCHDCGGRCVESTLKPGGRLVNAQ